LRLSAVFFSTADFFCRPSEARPRNGGVGIADGRHAASFLAFRGFAGGAASAVSAGFASGFASFGGSTGFAGG
jgi:hypothetical protein